MRAAALALALVLAGCAAKAPEEAAPPPGGRTTDGPAPPREGPFHVAVLTTVYAGGVGKELHGYAYVPPDDPGSLVVVVRGLKEGERAVHVHEAPSCRSNVSGNKTVAAGESGKRWGDDLPDLEVDARGNAAVVAPFSQPLSGRSVVVHALADAGAPGEEKAGPAVLCGVFEAKPWSETAETLGVVGAGLGDGRVELAPLFGTTYLRLAVRGVGEGAYVLSGADRDACEGASATATEAWADSPRLHPVAGVLRGAWVVDGLDLGAVKGKPVLLQKDREGAPVACGVVA